MISRKLEDARLSALTRKGVETAHTQNAGGKYIKSIVYGGLDGIITTFAVVSGVAGASLEAGVILILGSANLFADGIAMAFGDFLSTRAENEYHELERIREQHEIETDPEGELEELIQIYEAKGISRDESTVIANILFRHPKAVEDIMMVEELGILQSDESPLGNALATLGAFITFGALPLSIYVIERITPTPIIEHPLPIAIVITATTLFVLGAIKTRFTGRSWFKSGFEMLVVGGIAAAAAYGIGVLLEGLG